MSRPTAVEVEVVAFGAVTGTRSRTSLAVLGPTYSLAVEDLQRKYNESLHFTYSEPGARTCLTVVSKSSEFLADYYYRQERPGKVFVFVHGGGEMPGFPCSNGDFPTAAVLSLTSFWNSLTLNTITGIDLTRENLLPMLSTVLSLAQNPAEKHVNVIVSLLRQYAWKTIFIVHDKISGNPQDIFVQSYGPMMKQVGLLMLAAPRNELGVPTFHEMRSNDDDSCSDTLAKFQSVSRVMLFGGSEGIRKLMNMTDGSYVYITVDMWPEAPNQFWSSWYRPDITDHTEVSAATEAFRSVLTISRYYDGDFLKTNRSMDLFREFRRRTNTMYNITADEFTPDPAPIIGNLIGSYNALMIVGETIQKAWEDGDDLTDGRGLRRRLLNRTISTEFDRVYIDSYGQRIPDFSVSSFSPGSLDRTVFLLYRGGSPFLEPLILRPVSWPGIWPVPNEPVCGYRGDKCGISQLSNLGGLAGGVVTSLLLVMIAGCLLFVRYYLARIDCYWDFSQRRRQHRDRDHGKNVGNAKTNVTLLSCQGKQPPCEHP
ncbi:hypothetical protein BV898_08061 [Hypsibius exemplaris]|uniref:Receptor ligand binding region domain-containing protein n=1 Tax=Hypsibius exemplaris TaxID=2072580 RepID=A0A1W0WS08_HYPEX|nr:hypothetical protein BV898_08061 [Hypsibius exemplaris]